MTILIALAIAILSEFFRLYDTPELNAFRRTVAGQPLPDRIFSVWNIVTHVVGIVLLSQ
jgi:multisubunit Na+/H+ antiporter MnhF subunit